MISVFLKPYNMPHPESGCHRYTRSGSRLLRFISVGDALGGGEMPPPTAVMLTATFLPFRATSFPFAGPILWLRPGLCSSASSFLPAGFRPFSCWSRTISLRHLPPPISCSSCSPDLASTKALDFLVCPLRSHTRNQIPSSFSGFAFCCASSTFPIM